VTEALPAEVTVGVVPPNDTAIVPAAVKGVAVTDVVYVPSASALASDKAAKRVAEPASPI